MNPKSKQFCELQKYWYQKLADEGFEDIEASETILKKEADRSTKYYKDLLIRQNKQEYYLLIEQFLKEKICEFDDGYDYFVMVFWSKGYKNSEIVRKLKKLGHKINKTTVSFIIRRYEHKWGIRQWTPKQMGKKQIA